MTSLEMAGGQLHQKRCYHCQELKEVKNFNKNSNTKSGYQGYCRDCRKKRYLEDKDVILKKNRARYYKDHELSKQRNKIRSRKPNARFTMLKRGAKLRGLSVELSFKDYLEIIKDGTCHYCSAALPEFGGGVDRKDSDFGYAPNNSVPCCSECNSVKSDYLSYNEMVEVAKLLKKLRNDKN